MLKSQNMNLDYIRTLAILGQSGNMTEASIKMGVRTSYISRHISGLEETLSVKLIIPQPKNKPLKFTEAGKYFYDNYVQIYNQILKTEKDYLQSQDLNNCKITIGINSELEDNLLKPKLLKFKEIYPNVSIKVVNGDTIYLKELLSQYTVDFLISKSEIENTSKLEDITVIKLFTSNYCLIYNKDYFNSIDINNVPLIVPTKQREERKLIDNYFKENNIEPNIKYELDNEEKIISYVKDGLGVGIVLKDSLVNSSSLEMDDLDINTEICISYVKNQLAPTTKELLKFFNINL